MKELVPQKDKARQVLPMEGKHVFLGCSDHLLTPASAADKGFCRVREWGADGIFLGKAGA